VAHVNKAKAINYHFQSLLVSQVPLELFHSDVWGSAPTSVGRKNYYVSFVDDFSKYTWVYLIRHKLEVFSIFHSFQKLVERTFDKKIIVMQTDWGGEYQKLSTFFSKIGITHRVSCPHSHQQNSTVERKHRHIVEVGLSLLAHAHMPLKYWDETFATAAYLINRTPSKVIKYQTPIHKLSGATPNYSHMRVFGCACWPNLRPFNPRKLAFRSQQCVFLGYSSLHKGYKCLEVTSGQIYTSRDVVFDETVFPFKDLNHNAGAQLCADVMLLHPTLVPFRSQEHEVEDPINNSQIPAQNVEEITNDFDEGNNSSQPVQDSVGTRDLGSSSHEDLADRISSRAETDPPAHPQKCARTRGNHRVTHLHLGACLHLGVRLRSTRRLGANLH
jgi:hypothetical protein